MPELIVQLPLAQCLTLENFHTFSVNEKYRGCDITSIKLFTHYGRPGYAILYVMGIDKNECKFTKEIEMTYSSEIVDINTGVAKLNFKRKNTETWYKLVQNVKK